MLFSGKGNGSIYRGIFARGKCGRQQNIAESYGHLYIYLYLKGWGRRASHPFSRPSIYPSIHPSMQCSKSCSEARWPARWSLCLSSWHHPSSSHSSCSSSFSWPDPACIWLYKQYLPLLLSSHNKLHQAQDCAGYLGILFFTFRKGQPHLPPKKVRP